MAIKNPIIFGLKMMCLLTFLNSQAYSFNNTNPKGRPFFSGNIPYTDQDSLFIDETIVGKSKWHSYIAPAALIAGGMSIHYHKEANKEVRGWFQEHITYKGYIDDYGQYFPLAAVYTLYASGFRGENNFGNKTALVIKSFLLNGLLTYGLKTQIDAIRPNGESRSFPSGHASKAFTLAHFMHHEYGSLSTWYSIGAYASATTVSLMRLAKDEHWVSDVIMGAGVGILSTELIYRTHQYKWDKEYLKNLNLFPFKNDTGSGITLLYTF